MFKIPCGDVEKPVTSLLRNKNINMMQKERKSLNTHSNIHYLQLNKAKANRATSLLARSMLMLQDTGGKTGDMSQNTLKSQ